MKHEQDQRAIKPEKKKKKTKTNQANSELRESAVYKLLNSGASPHQPRDPETPADGGEHADAPVLQLHCAAAVEVLLRAVALAVASAEETARCATNLGGLSWSLHDSQLKKGVTPNIWVDRPLFEGRSEDLVWGWLHCPR